MILCAHLVIAFLEVSTSISTRHHIAHRVKHRARSVLCHSERVSAFRFATPPWTSSGGCLVRTSAENPQARNVAQDAALIGTTSLKLAWLSSTSAGLCLIVCDDRAALAAARIVISCQACGNIVFENRSCGRCDHRLALLPQRVILSALKRTGDQRQPFERPNKGGGSAPTPRWMPATGLWMTAPVTLTAQFAATMAPCPISPIRRG
jgi:hypothetical protein